MKTKRFPLLSLKNQINFFKIFFIILFNQFELFKLNEKKSVHIDFTNRRIDKSSVILNKNIIFANTTKHLGMNLDIRLSRKGHIETKGGRTEHQI